MTGEMVHFQEEKGIGGITIDHPPVNALNQKVLTELSSLLSTLEKREDFLVVIITGAGEKAFVGGADITEFSSLDYPGGMEFIQRGQTIFNQLEALPFPVLAAINGYALGGGCELALSCDIRLMANTARLGQPEVNLGIIPGYGGTQRLPRLIPVGRAKELIYTGEMLEANEAKELGLVERVVSPENLLAEAKKMARTILAKGPLAVMKAKKAVNDGLQMTLKEGLELEKELFASLCETEDMKEGARAFLEKRRPNFKGR